jgi:tRNA(Ile)-lysidine synthase
MDLLEKFKANFKQQFSELTSTHCHFFLAVSGGIDSIVLTELFFRSGFDFSIAHCNFQLRGNESNDDEIFVEQIAKKYQKEFFVKKFDTEEHAAENKISIQEAARNLRYEWFHEILNRQFVIHDNRATDDLPFTIRVLATAHHADDNIETTMLNFFRGTGLQGLKGISVFDKKRKIIRPLLFARREEILIYAKENNLQWREDSSNASDKYTRNFFRHQIISLMKEKIPSAEENILRNIPRFNEENIVYENAIVSIKNKLLEQKGNEIHIPILKLKKQIPLKTIVWEIFKTYHFNSSQTDEIIKLFDAENSSFIKNELYTIIKNRNWLIIAPNQTESSQHILIEKIDTKIVFENGTLTLEQLPTSNHKLQTTNSTASLDADKIIFPLLLRKWKQGDYFYPLGMDKKKKLSKFFIDNKLSKTEKGKVWVIEMDKKIIWVINHRIDGRFRVLPATKNFLKITFNH